MPTLPPPLPSIGFNDYTIPSERVTTYACQSFNIDVDGGDKHVVAIRPIVNAPTAWSNHHAILHVCSNNAFWSAHNAPKPCAQSHGDEGQSPLGELNSGCSSLIWTWAVGGGDFVLPADVGFRIGGSLIATSHVILEVHYDNPRSLAGQVRARLRTNLQPQTRPARQHCLQSERERERGREGEGEGRRERERARGMEGRREGWREGRERCSRATVLFHALRFVPCVPYPPGGQLRL